MTSFRTGGPAILCVVYVVPCRQYLLRSSLRIDPFLRRLGVAPTQALDTALDTTVRQPKHLTNLWSDTTKSRHVRECSDRILSAVINFIITSSLFFWCNQVRHHLSMSPRLNRSFLYNVIITPNKGVDDYDGREKQISTIFTEASQGELSTMSNTQFQLNIRLTNLIFKT